jgi:hypothetical protein
LTRDTFLGALGTVILLNETFLQRGAERHTLMLVAAGLLGLPVWLRVDEKRQRTSSDDSDDS